MRRGERVRAIDTSMSSPLAQVLTGRLLAGRSMAGVGGSLVVVIAAALAWAVRPPIDKGGATALETLGGGHMREPCDCSRELRRVVDLLEALAF